MTVTYRKRKNLFAKGEDEWRVEDDALIWRRPNGGESRYLWNDVKHVRASYLPTQYAPWRHVFVVTFGHGRPVSLDNAHYRGFADVEDRSESYARLVHEAVARIAKASPKAHGHLGATPFGYYVQLGFVILMFILLVIVLAVIPVQANELFWARVFVILAAVPLFYRWVVRARPRGAPLDPETFVAGLPGHPDLMEARKPA